MTKMFYSHWLNGLSRDFRGEEPPTLPTDAPGPAINVNQVGVTPSLSADGSLTSMGPKYRQTCQKLPWLILGYA
jgi:hypothetical protein